MECPWFDIFDCHTSRCSHRMELDWNIFFIYGISVVFYSSRRQRQMTCIFSFQSIITKQLLSSPRRCHTLPLIPNRSLSYDTLYWPILVSSAECGRGRMIVGFTTTYATIAIVSSNPAHGDVYSIQHYVIMFVSDLWQFCDFLRVLRIPPPINLKGTIYLKYCWKWR